MCFIKLINYVELTCWVFMQTGRKKYVKNVDQLEENFTASAQVTPKYDSWVIIIQEILDV